MLHGGRRVRIKKRPRDLVAQLSDCYLRIQPEVDHIEVMVNPIYGGPGHLDVKVRRFGEVDFIVAATVVLRAKASGSGLRIWPDTRTFGHGYHQIVFEGAAGCGGRTGGTAVSIVGG